MGLVMLAAPTAVFRSFYANALSGPNDVMTLVREDGQVLVRYPVLQKPLLRITSGLMDAIKLNPDQGFYTVRSAADGVDRLYAYMRLPDFPLYVTYGGEKARMWAAWRHDLAGC
jgi:hypothetical protein